MQNAFLGKDDLSTANFYYYEQFKRSKLHYRYFQPTYWTRNCRDLL